MQYFLTLNKPIPLTPLLREYFNPLIICPLVLIPAFRLSVEARIRYCTCCVLNCWYMYTHPYIHSSNENSRVDCSRSSSQGAWLAESRSAFTRILAHQPPGQLPVSPEPGSGADVRATRGQHLSAAQSGQQMSASPPCHPRGPGVLDGPGPHPRPRPSAGRPILRPLSLLGRKSTFSFFPLPLHFLPSHLPSSLALLFLFSHFSPLRQPHPHLKKSPASKVFPFYGLESNVLEVLGGRVIKIKKI